MIRRPINNGENQFVCRICVGDSVPDEGGGKDRSAGCDFFFNRKK